MDYATALEALGTVWLAADAFRAVDIACLKIRRELIVSKYRMTDSDAGKKFYKDECDRHLNALLNYSATGPLTFLAKWIYI